MSENAILAPDIDMPRPGAGPFYEVIDGQVVEPPEMSAFEIYIANRISGWIGDYFTSSKRLGRTVVEMLFRLNPESNRKRRPDFAFVSYERWPRKKPIPFTEGWEVVPDLAVEVVSPGDLAVEILDKLEEYFRAGVRQVWLVYPRQQRIYIYHDLKTIVGLDITDTLDGGDILPGFTLPLASLLDETEGMDS